MNENTKKQLSKKRKLLFSIISTMLILLVIFICGELIFRAFVFVRGQSYPTKTTELDDKFGWKPKSNFSFEGLVKDAAGAEYPLKMSTNENGFRAFGDVKTGSDKKRLFFIGDSYTQAIEVSDDKTYYKLVGDSLDAEVYAYGGRGFGTLQQSMVLKEYYDLVHPDVVVLQMCYNDFINNVYELEKDAAYNNNRLKRPYLEEDGNIIYKNPARIPPGFITSFSQLIPYLLIKLERSGDNQLVEEKRNSEFLIESQGLDFEGFKTSVARTERILKQIKYHLKEETQLAVFLTESFPQYQGAVQNICNKNQILFINGVGDKLKAAADSEVCIMAEDNAHWNNRGHEIVAVEIVNGLRELE